MLARSSSQFPASRLQILKQHLEAENSHNLDALMETFSEGALVFVNGQPFDTPERIRGLHEDFGFGERGAFSDVTVEEWQRYITDEAVIIEQTLSGRHTGRWEGIAPTGKPFKIPVCTIYIFNEDGRLAQERVYFDWALLHRQLGLL